MELLLILFLLEARRRMFFFRRPPMPFVPMMRPMGPRLVRRPHGFHHHGPRF